MPIDVIVLAGFLGSGKTSLLVDGLSQGLAESSAVIVNEVGQIGIDGATIADGSDGVPIEMLDNGCVCCSLGGSLVQTLGALLSAPRPVDAPPLARVIIETSGISRPGPILASLGDDALAHWPLRTVVVTTYDCARGGADEAQFDEAVAQLAAAQRIVVTKADLVSSDDLEDARRRVLALNPLAEVLCSQDRETLARMAFEYFPVREPMPSPQTMAVTAAVRHPRISVLTGEMATNLNWDGFSVWLDAFAGYCGERLLRTKAVVHVTDCESPLLVQGVGSSFDVPRRLDRTSPLTRSFIAIVRDFALEDFQALHLGDAVRLHPAG